MSSYYHPLGDEGWSIRVDYDYTPHQPRTAWEPEYPEDISITGIWLGGREISDSIIYQMRDGTDDSKWRAYLDHLRDCIKDDIEEQRAYAAECAAADEERRYAT